MKVLMDLRLLIITILNLCLIEATRPATSVTCGSVIKLVNVDYKTRLHSHDVKYGSGSGQQSVTGVENTDDVNSHWIIKGKTGSMCSRGVPVKCGDIIRLQHLVTKKNLHSHFFTSPLSGNQEISAYGDDDGVGDTGDHWEVICYGDSWLRNLRVQFRHVDTRKFLGVSGRSFGRPISGQMEIVGLNSGTTGSEWQSAEGIFIHPSDLVPKKIEHNEL